MIGVFEMTAKMELLKHYICDTIYNLEIDGDEVSDNMALNVLEEIRQIIQNDEYSDFDKVEKIVCLFEEYDIDAGACHDFG